jgi:hypothetical protein
MSRWVPQARHVVRIGGREQVLEPRPDERLGTREPVHPGHRVVALGEPRMAIDVLDLRLVRQAHVERLLQLDPPHALGALLDERAVALLAPAQLLVDLRRARARVA